MKPEKLNNFVVKLFSAILLPLFLLISSFNSANAQFIPTFECQWVPPAGGNPGFCTPNLATENCTASPSTPPFCVDDNVVTGPCAQLLGEPACNGYIAQCVICPPTPTPGLGTVTCRSTFLGCEEVPGTNTCTQGTSFNCSNIPNAFCDGVHNCHAPYSTPTPPGGGTWQPDYCAGGQGIQTALGCINTNPQEFINNLFTILLGLGGGIAFLLMIVGALFVLTSQGQPERVSRGKEVFVGAISGLLMIIFSTFLLELIGVDILGIFQP